MRHSPRRPRLDHGHAWRTAIGLALVIALPQAAPAQATAPEAPPLARFVPRDDLVAYAEFAGLDTHADAWKKTAAYKMLNETSLGAMLEDLGTQLVDQALAKAPARKISGAEVVTLAKHAFHSGFAFGMNAKPGAENPSSVVLVLRGAARKDVRAPVSKALLSFGGKAGKPKLASKPGDRTVAIMPSDARAESWVWWAEKEDVVIGLDQPGTADTVVEVLDGKKPSAVDQPTRTELAKSENGFLPVGWAFLDSGKVPAPKGAGDRAKAQLAGVQRIDFQWGFQDNALMNVWRLAAPEPHQGILALLDAPKFDLSSLPPMPEEIDGFTALSLDLPQALDTLAALAKSANPQAGEQLDGAIDMLKTKYKIDLRKDVLGQLGPKMTFYVAPGKLAPAPAAGSERPDAGAGGMPNPLTMMLASVQVPKFALVFEAKKASAFAKKLDEVMIAANKLMRESAKVPVAEGGEGTPPPAERKRASANAPAPKLEMMPGKAKAYALVLPAELGKLPPGVKPTIRVGEKYVAIGVNPAVAGQALEAKEAWKPSGDFASALASAPTGLVLLNVSDPRNTMPQDLASLPRTLQTAINAATQTAVVPAVPAGGAAAPGFPGAGPGSSSYPGTSAGTSPPQVNSSATPPGYGSPPGDPNAPGATGGPPGAAPPAGVVLRVDPSKMPSADALKPFLFPGYAALSVTDQGIRFVTREAFPNLASGGGMTSPASSMILGPAIRKAREAALKQVAGQAKAGGAAPADKPK